MARTLSDLGVKLGIIGNNTTQISFDDLNTELGVSSETTRDLGGFSIAGISSLSTSDTTPDEATTVQFQMVPTDVAGSPGFTTWQASDLASTISHFTWGSSLGGVSFSSADYIADCTFPNVSANVLTSITLTYNDGWNPSMSGNVNVTVQNTGTGTGGGGGSANTCSYAGGAGGAGGGTTGEGSTKCSDTDDAAANSGGGSGGTQTNDSGNGGSGVVILKLPTANYVGVVTGSPTVTTSGSNTIVKFTGSGTFKT